MPQFGDYVLKPTFNDRGRRFVPAIGKSLRPQANVSMGGSHRVAARGPLRRRPFCRYRTRQAGRGASVAADCPRGPPWYGCLPCRTAPAAGTNARGLARIAPEGKDVVSMYRGGSSADFWVITGHGSDDATPLSPTLTPISTTARRLECPAARRKPVLVWSLYGATGERDAPCPRVTLEALGPARQKKHQRRWSGCIALHHDQRLWEPRVATAGGACVRAGSWIASPPTAMAALAFLQWRRH